MLPHPTPVEIEIGILDAIAAYERDNPETPFTATALFVIQRGVKEACRRFDERNDRA